MHVAYLVVRRGCGSRWCLASLRSARNGPHKGGHTLCLCIMRPPCSRACTKMNSDVHVTTDHTSMKTQDKRLKVCIWNPVETSNNKACFHTPKTATVKKLQFGSLGTAILKASDYFACWPFANTTSIYWRCTCIANPRTCPIFHCCLSQTLHAWDREAHTDKVIVQSISCFCGQTLGFGITQDICFPQCVLTDRQAKETLG